MNSIAELKSILHHYIAETDDVKVLSKLQQYIKGLLEKEDKIIAYTSQGQPLTRAAYKKVQTHVEKEILSLNFHDPGLCILLVACGILQATGPRICKTSPFHR